MRSKDTPPSGAQREAMSLLDEVRSRITNPDVLEAHDFSLWGLEMAGLL